MKPIFKQPLGQIGWNPELNNLNLEGRGQQVPTAVSEGERGNPRWRWWWRCWRACGPSRTHRSSSTESPGPRRRSRCPAKWLQFAQVLEIWMTGTLPMFLGFCLPEWVLGCTTHTGGWTLKWKRSKCGMICISDKIQWTELSLKWKSHFCRMSRMSLVEIGHLPYQGWRSNKSHLLCQGLI